MAKSITYLAKQRERRKKQLEKICERCGNPNYVRKTIYRCSYCGWLNGLDNKDE